MIQQHGGIVELCPRLPRPEWRCIGGAVLMHGATGAPAVDAPESAAASIAVESKSRTITKARERGADVSSAAVRG